MKLTFLGTGTSFGVPVVGCRCATCTSDDPRDRRTRHGALLTTAQGRLLVDTPPELRLQLLREGVDSVDAVWYTHLHADHVHGIDDLRICSVRNHGRPVPAYVPEEDRASLEGRFRYIFDADAAPPPGSSRPEIRLRTYRSGMPETILDRSFLPLAVPHGPMTVHGFRTGPLGYVTDAKRLPARTLEGLQGVRVLVLNALWFGNPHPSHFNVEEAVEAAAEVGAERTYLTHLTHRVRHRELMDWLPADVRPAHDGLTVELPEESDALGPIREEAS